MDGFTDSPFRSICRSFGSALSTSEFINGIDIAFGHPHLKFKTHFQDVERPVSLQIFDDDPDRLLNGALRLAQFNPDLLDINLGCSARNVSNRGAGAGLLKRLIRSKRSLAIWLDIYQYRLLQRSGWVGTITHETTWKSLGFWNLAVLALLPYTQERVISNTRGQPIGTRLLR